MKFFREFQKMASGAFAVTIFAISIQSANAGNDETHFISIGSLPFEGGYQLGRGLVDVPFYSEGESAIRRMEELTKRWGISEKSPLVVDGATWSGDSVRIEILGASKNEFGATLVTKSLPENAGSSARPATGEPMIFWTGKLNLKVIIPVKIKLAYPDTTIIERECQARGLEMKVSPHSVWYLDPLDDNDKEDMADPLNSRNIQISAIAPSPESNVLLVSCFYFSKARPGVAQYRGPVLKYDTRIHRVDARDSIDLDEHFRFIDIDGVIYSLSYWYNDPGEVYGYRLESYATRTVDNGSNGKPDGNYYYIFDGVGGRLVSTFTWFDE